MIEECQRYGVEPPRFEEDAGFVVVTFRASIGPGKVEGPRRDQAGTKSGPSPEDISPRAGRIVAILMERGPLGSAALLRELGEPITQRALQTELRRLREAGLVASAGKGRATTYRAVTGEV